MTRSYTDILKELHDQTHYDGYYGRMGNLEEIVDELVEGMKYAGLLENDSVVKSTFENQETRTIFHCQLREDKT